MAVRLLAGPFSLRNYKGDLFQYVTSHHGWYPHVGLIINGIQDMQNPSTGELYLGTLDGVVAQATSFKGMNLSWWPHRQRLVWIDGLWNPAQEFMFEPMAMVWEQTAPEDQPEYINSVTSIHLYRYAKLPDRRIYIRNNRVFRQVNGLPDAAESAAFPFLAQDVLPGRSDVEVFVQGIPLGSGDNRSLGCFYDTVTKTISSPVYYLGIVSDLLMYAPEYGVMVSLHRGEFAHNGHEYVVTKPNEIRIWSLEVAPTVLTAPEPFIGTVRAGQVVTFRVRLTGAHNDPAEDELINWNLRGTGKLLDAQSKTDAQGYATTQVQYGLQAIGESVLEASVLC